MPHDSCQKKLAKHCVTSPYKIPHSELAEQKLGRYEEIYPLLPSDGNSTMATATIQSN